MIVLEIPDACDITHVRDQWENRYSGLSNAFKPAIFKTQGIPVWMWCVLFGAALIYLVMFFSIDKRSLREPIGIDIGNAASDSVSLIAPGFVNDSFWLPFGISFPYSGRVSDALQWEAKRAAMSLREEGLFEPIVLTADWSGIPEIDIRRTEK